MASLRPGGLRGGRREAKPVFFLLSASWCHWCHVYERETIEEPSVAKRINEAFVPVFVDADERHDLEREYLYGGWPTTILFTPEGREVHAFSGHLPSERFHELLTQVKTHLEELPVEERHPLPAPKLAEREKAKLLDEAGLHAIPALLEEKLLLLYDSTHGGWGQGQKFPFPESIDYCLDKYEQSKDESWLAMGTQTLDAIAGGLQDLVEHGFYRYCVQPDWSEPHYEKMLVGNAGLAARYAYAHEVTRSDKYLKTAHATLDWLLENLYDPKEGGFYASMDADEEYYALGSLEERKKHERPFVDLRKFCDRNAWALALPLYYTKELRHPRATAAFLKSLDFLLKRLWDSKLGALHYYDENRKRGVLDGQLADNAWLAAALQDAHHGTGDKKHLARFRTVLDLCIERLYDKEGGGFFERNSSSHALYRLGEERSERKPYLENGILAIQLARAAELFNEPRYKQLALETLSATQREDFRGLDETVYHVWAARRLLEKG